MIYYQCDGFNCGVRVVMTGTSLKLPDRWAEMSITMALKPTVVKHLCPSCIEKQERHERGEIDTPQLKGKT